MERSRYIIIRARLTHLPTPLPFPHTLPQGAFRALVRRAPGLLTPDALIGDVDFIFLRNLGFTDPKCPKFELKFDHFLDALQDLALARYPNEASLERSLTLLVANHIRPLYVELFGEAAHTQSVAFDSDVRSTTSRCERGGGDVAR